MLLQNPALQLFGDTVLDDILLQAQKTGGSAGSDLYENAPSPRQQAEDILQQLGLDASFLPRSPYELSFGETKKVALAGQILAHPDLLLLDEPMSGLDEASTQQVVAVLRKVAEQGKQLGIATHDELEGYFSGLKIEKQLCKIENEFSKLHKNHRRRRINPVVKVMKNVLKLSPVIIFTSLFQFWMTHSVSEALWLGGRFLAIILLAQILVLKINPVALVKHVPGKTLSFTLALAFMFIRRLEKIFADIKLGASVREIKSRFGLKLVPHLFVQVVLSAEKVANALKLRGL
jgi:hypothetical protein